MNYWTTAENTFYSSWSEHNENKSMNDFYAEQKNEAITLQGVLEPYHSSVKSKPGDFVLVNQSSHLPIAYLYSTQVNLDSYVGKEVSVIVSSRPNRHFAFPAYFVLGAQ